MDSDEFSQIVARYYEPLYRFALSLTRDEADAQDLTQETFQVWAAKGYQLRDRSKAKAWLFTTLHRAFLTARHRRSRFRHDGLEEVAIEDLPAVSPNFANAVDAPQVLSALAQVDEVYQAAVALFYLEDYSQNEIARILEVPVGTVKSRIARGIAQLRQLLGHSEPASSPIICAIRPTNFETCKQTGSSKLRKVSPAPISSAWSRTPKPSTLTTKPAAQICNPPPIISSAPSKP